MRANGAALAHEGQSIAKFPFLDRNEFDVACRSFLSYAKAITQDDVWNKAAMVGLHQEGHVETEKVSYLKVVRRIKIEHVSYDLGDQCVNKQNTERDEQDDEV